jgi:hypothetical protein
MRFEFYTDELAPVAPKLCVDGLVENSIHLSHWNGNRTPARLRADTSTEIALNFVSAADRADVARGAEIVTNNHFDTDGLLSVWTMLAGERALELREPLINAAASGDFSEFTGAAAVRASIVIQGGAISGAFPLAQQLAGGGLIDEKRAYMLTLPEVERVLRTPGAYEALWRDEWAEIERSMESFASGRSFVMERARSGLSVVMLDSGFGPTPFTAIAHHARGRVFLICAPKDGGWSYRVDYPYYSWAVTVTRPTISRISFDGFCARLNELERDQGRWRTDGRELASALKFMDPQGALARSSLPPDTVAGELETWLTTAAGGGSKA